MGKLIIGIVLILMQCIALAGVALLPYLAMKETPARFNTAFKALRAFIGNAGMIGLCGLALDALEINYKLNVYVQTLYSIIGWLAVAIGLICVVLCFTRATKARREQRAR